MLGIWQAFNVEVVAIQFGLSIAKNVGLRLIKVESDVLEVINILHDPHRVLAPILVIIDGIQAALTDLLVLSFKFVTRA